MPLHTRCTQQQNQGEEWSLAQASCERPLMHLHFYKASSAWRKKKKGTRGVLSCSIGPERFLSPVKERAQHLKRRRRKKEKKKEIVTLP